MSLDSKNDMTRDQLVKFVGDIPKDIWKMSKEDQASIIQKKVVEVKEVFEGIKTDSSFYRFSGRQESTRENAHNATEAKDFLDAYWEIFDFLDDYRDRHNGVVFETERQEFLKMLDSLYSSIVE